MTVKTNALVIEHNDFWRAGIEFVLENIDVNVCTAPDRSSAIDKFLLDKFQLVIVDCELPSMSGLECAFFIRAMEYGAETRIPIIGLVENPSIEFRRKCFQSGVDVLVERDCSQEDLEKTVTKWLRNLRS